MLPFCHKMRSETIKNRCQNKHTGSTPTITQVELWVFLIAREMPVIVPPVPALATITSTFSDEGFEDVDGVETTASMISGPVVYS